ncbi:MAG: GAF domain-containing protein [Acidimicrobiales bacterium]
MTVDWETAVRDVERVAALHDSGLLGTGPEEEFDRLVELAVKLTGATCSCITLVDAEMVSCKSSIGLPQSMPLRLGVIDTFCRYVVGSRRPFVVDDAVEDSRVFDDPVTSNFGIGAWAGYPITDPDGYTLGTLCVIDIHSHAWTEVDILVLATLAKAVSTEIALRKSRDALLRVRGELEDLRRQARPPM